MSEENESRAAVSDELEAMSRCYEALKDLPAGSQELIMEWLGNRFEAEVDHVVQS